MCCALKLGLGLSWIRHGFLSLARAHSASSFAFLRGKGTAFCWNSQTFPPLFFLMCENTRRPCLRKPSAVMVSSQRLFCAKFTEICQDIFSFWATNKQKTAFGKQRCRLGRIFFAVLYLAQNRRLAIPRFFLKQRIRSIWKCFSTENCPFSCSKCCAMKTNTL